MHKLENGTIINLVNSDNSGESSLYELIESFESNGATYFALIPHFEVPEGVEEIKVALLFTKSVTADDAEFPHMQPVEDPEELDWVAEEFSKTVDGIEKSYSRT